MQSNTRAATAARELEHYFTLQTYGHAAALALAWELVSPLAEQAEDSNPGAPEHAPCGLTDLSHGAVAMEAPLGPRTTVAEAQGSA
jgi:hypothetical protein